MGQSMLEQCVRLAETGTRAAVDTLMEQLTMEMTIAESKILDYALSVVSTEEGFQAVEHYLFHGTQIQRNYATLYFIRREEFPMVRKAYEMGLIDKLQAFTR